MLRNQVKPLLTFIILLLAALTILEIISLHPSMRDLNALERCPFKIFSGTVTIFKVPKLFPNLEQFITARYTRIGFLGTLYGVMSETIRFQLIFWLALILRPKLPNTFLFSHILPWIAFSLSLLSFLADHLCYGESILAAAVIFNFFVWRYQSLLPAFLVHLSWNALQPILHPLSEFISRLIL